MATTNVEIVNDALARLGVSPINALADATKQAQFANRFYNQTLDEVLAARQWPFATKRATLTVITPKPTAEWAYGYTLPADYLRLVQINNDEVAMIKHRYAIEGSRLLIDETPAAIAYVARETAVSTYSPLFCEALSIKLASKLCGPLTGSKEMAVEFLKLYEQTLKVPEIGEQPNRTRRAKSATVDAVEIANMALAMIGTNPILTLSDTSVQAQMADRFYATTRDEVISSHRWNFAMRRAALVAATPAPSFEWDFAYTLPTGCLRVVQLNGYEPTEALGEFVIENNQLLTDANPAQVRYIVRVTDTTAFPPLFVSALATLLAARIAPSLGVSPSIVEALESKYYSLTGPKARMADVFEQHPVLKPAWADSALVRSRFTRYVD